MYEVEFKADVTGVVHIDRRIAACGARYCGEMVYHDRYYDTPDGNLVDSDRELRLRVCSGSRSFSLLTYKSGPFHAQSRSKEEHETDVADPVAMACILGELGFVPVCTLVKRCTRHTLERAGCTVDLTLASVDGVSGRYLELEIPTSDASQVACSCGILRGLLDELGIPGHRLTTECYTEMVARHAGEFPR